MKTIRLEYCNGEEASLTVFLKRLCATQDMDAWRKNPQGFQTWLRGEMVDFVRNLDVKILP
jgi:hypothetical protein